LKIDFKVTSTRRLSSGCAFFIPFMKRSLPFLLLVCCLACSKVNESITAEITSLKEQFAPDSRVAVWNITWDGKILSGETDQSAAYQKLIHTLDSLDLSYDDNILLLPDPKLGDKTRAVVTLSVANIRSAPKHSAELATQATLGTPLKVLKQEGSWYSVQTPDGYISWVDAAGIQLMTEDQLKEWMERELMVFTAYQGFLYSSPEAEAVISDLVAGNIFALLEPQSGGYQVVLPDGRQGWVDGATVSPFEKWVDSRSTDPENLINTAMQMMGVPYLWGGTSVKGMDCSGFTKTVFFLNGKVIPRDASQQVWEGEEIETAENWNNLEVGDLLFFGEKATAEKKEKVVHVGMWIGNNSFIHARGRVRISSFNPESDNYDEYELNRYLRTKRIIGKDNKNVSEVRKLTQF
jgi:gamma-D-glutamyl-L-lysine dipeptidyl-peptidase